MKPLDDIFARLAKSPFRCRFQLGAQDRAYLDSKGREAVLDHAATFIAERLAPANPRNDGQQTPMRGHPVFVAQHATATCCRGCLAKWHAIPAGGALTDDEQRHVLAVIARWLDHQATRETPPRQVAQAKSRKKQKSPAGAYQASPETTLQLDMFAAEPPPDDD
ncbi:MAG: DUF4186 domain-containing protein [Hyphomicrobiaceae bacterium]|nr:DUF4186 domain-containing protein [Hyphomicrobiaceae bacterium]